MKYGKKYKNQPLKEDDEGTNERWGGDGDGDGWGRGGKQNNNGGNRNEKRK